ncbi:hypothetical protein [Sagittula sp. NFXS13]|uniref:hypothetical protein n=1 Tax=Sagittula sp. NFXS13 TaxID=2819095 RepID=UPI0032DEB7E0
MLGQLANCKGITAAASSQQRTTHRGSVATFMYLVCPKRFSDTFAHRAIAAFANFKRNHLVDSLKLIARAPSRANMGKHILTYAPEWLI